MAVFKSETADAQVAEVGFKHGVVIMAVFAALPTTELVRSYLGVSTEYFRFLTRLYYHLHLYHTFVITLEKHFTSCWRVLDSSI